MLPTGIKKPALACAKSGHNIPSLASIYKALCKLSSNQRLISLYAYGLFSQQLIIAEGGFKSKLEPSFSNTWMTTLNISTNIWKWIYAYGDVGLVNNKYQATETFFDSGIRLSLVEDYFELYFPVYSNLGWEIAQPNYEEKIRFIITLDTQTLFGLFSRKWY